MNNYIERGLKKEDFKKIVEDKFYSKYNDKSLLERCYKEIDILSNNNQLQLVFLLYICKQKYNYLFHFRGMINNLFIMYVLDLSIVNPLPKHYYCDKCKNVYYENKKCPNCHEILKMTGYNLPYELYIDKAISVDVIENCFLSLVYDLSNLLALSDFRLVKGGFKKDEDSEIKDVKNSLYDNHYLLVPIWENNDDLILKYNDGMLETVEDYHNYKNKYPLIIINEKDISDSFFDNEFERDLAKILKPKTLEDYSKIISAAHGTYLWLDNQEKLLDIVNIENMISCREDVLEYLLNHNIDIEKALEITNFIRTGKVRENITKWNEYVILMRKNNFEDIFIKIFSKVLYLFGRGQAISECLWVIKMSKTNKSDGFIIDDRQ